MKPSLSIILTSGVLAFEATLRAAIPVVDAPRQAQAEVHHQQTMLVLTEVTLNQRAQLDLLNQQLLQLEQLNAVVGDPLKVTSMPGSEAVLGASTGSQISPAPGGDKIAIQASLSHLDGGHGLFAVVGASFKTLDGTEITRNESGYLPMAAIVGARSEHEATLKTVMERRQQLREGARQTLEAIGAATTLAEVQKLHAVLSAQHLELDANDRDLFFTAQKTELQDIDNRNNKERETLARNEEQAAEIRTALARMAESLQIKSQPLRLRRSR